MMINNNKCRGFSLIELLAVISLSGILLVITVGWIHESLKFSSSLRQRQRHHQSLIRLANELRNDVRQSSAMSMKDESQLVLESANEMQITYTIQENSLVVEKRKEGAIVFTDRFRLAPNSETRWEPAELPNWISLIVSRKPIGTPSQDPDTPSTDDSRLPVDLHVRVGPHPWPTKIAGSKSGSSSSPASAQTGAEAPIKDSQ